MFDLDTHRLEGIEYKYNISYSRIYDLCLFVEYRMFYRTLRSNGLFKAVNKNYGSAAVDLVERYYSMRGG